MAVAMSAKTLSERPQVLIKTVELLRNRPVNLTFPKIAKETGLTIAWLTNLASESSDNDPSVTRIVKLYEYLSGNKLIAP